MVNKARENMGIGLIVRDHEGVVLATLQAPRQHIIDLATAALKATAFARKLGHQHAELEGYAIQIVQALNK